MNTFLPYPDFIESAKSLDKKRCWKQVVEAQQILSVISGTSTSWENHPAVKMWVGHKVSLIKYFNAFLNVCIEKHGINTKYTEHIYFTRKPVEIPWWLGNEDFHRAMRARLIEKDEAFYLPLFPEDKGFNDGKYFWPVMDGSNTFRII